MVSSEIERSGLLVLKIRPLAAESGSSTQRLAATITTTLDLSTRQETRTNARSQEEILTIVRQWIEAFTGDGPNDAALTDP